jgi:hypothetical protein
MSAPISLTVVNNLTKAVKDHALALDAVRQTLSGADRPLNDFLITKSNAVKIEMKIHRQRRKFMGNSNYVQAYINNVNNKVKFLLPQGDGRRPAPNSRMWNEKTLITNYQNYENGRYVVKYPAIEEKLSQPEKKEEKKPVEEKVEEKKVEAPFKPQAQPDASATRRLEARSEKFITEGQTVEVPPAKSQPVGQPTGSAEQSTIAIERERGKRIATALASTDDDKRLEAINELLESDTGFVNYVLTQVPDELKNRIPAQTPESFLNWARNWREGKMKTSQPKAPDAPKTIEPEVKVGEAVTGAPPSTRPTQETPSTAPTTIPSTSIPRDADRRAGGGGIAGQARIDIVEGLREGGGGKGVDIDGDGIPDAPFVDLDGDGVPDILPPTVQQLGKRVQEEDEQRATFTIDRLKEEIRAYHLVYENNIPEFRDKSHKVSKDKALKSKNVEDVRKHHKDMEFMIARYFKSEPKMRLGVIIDAEEYLSGLFGANTTTQSTTTQPTTTTQGMARPNQLIHNTYISGGLSVAQRKPIVNRMVRTIPQKEPSKINPPEKTARVDTFRAYTLPRHTPQKPMLNIKFKSNK